MKKILGVALAALFLSSCNGGGGGTGGPPPTPTPEPTPTVSPTSTPSTCGAASIFTPTHRGRHIMLPRGAYAAAKGAGLSYGGGSVLVDQAIYLVTWGFGASDPVAQRLAALYTNVGGSDWFGTVTQYCESPDDYITNSTGSFAGNWADTQEPVPLQPTQAEIESEAVRAAAHFGGIDLSTATIVVATPTGHSMAGFGTQFCGWHDATNGGLSYEYIPYEPDAGSACGANSVKDQYDGVSIVGGHEFAESTTDPQPSTGWVDAKNGEEIGDLCAWKDLKLENLNGVELPMQPLWSNATGACEQ